MSPFARVSCVTRIITMLFWWDLASHQGFVLLDLKYKLNYLLN